MSSLGRLHMADRFPMGFGFSTTVTIPRVFDLNISF